jgi:hypothetical protein
MLTSRSACGFLRTVSLIEIKSAGPAGSGASQSERPPIGVESHDLFAHLGLDRCKTEPMPGPVSRDRRDTFFRLRGTTEPETIGQAVLSGGIRLLSGHRRSLQSRPVGAHGTVVQG